MVSAYLSALSRGIAPFTTAKPSRTRSSLQSPKFPSLPSSFMRCFCACSCSTIGVICCVSRRVADILRVLWLDLLCGKIESLRAWYHSSRSKSYVLQTYLTTARAADTKNRWCTMASPRPTHGYLASRLRRGLGGHALAVGEKLGKSGQKNEMPSKTPQWAR